MIFLKLKLKNPGFSKAGIFCFRIYPNFEPMTDWKELAAQLRQPTGEAGLHTAEKMNESNGLLYQLMFSILSEKQIDTSTILEIGFGNGLHFSQILEQLNCQHLTGLDFSKDMCNEALKRNLVAVSAGKLNIVCEDLLNNTLPHQAFDLILGLNIIYFWQPFESYINALKPLLKPNGILALGFRPEACMKLYPFSAHGFKLYSEEELNRLMQQQGFELIYSRKESLLRIAVDGNEYPSEDICTLFRPV